MQKVGGERLELCSSMRGIEKQVTLKTTPEHQSHEGEVSGGGF
jgi:hypothetical protein